MGKIINGKEELCRLQYQEGTGISCVDVSSEAERVRRTEKTGTGYSIWTG